MSREEYKQAIVVRRDLGMGRGKAAAQAAHASCGAVFLIMESGRPEWRRWLESWRRQGQAKVVLRVDSLHELQEIYRRAVEEGLPASFVRDAGKTQLEPGTPTAVAVGPAPSRLVDRITGSLKLF
ncbi:peptidyl-tRNA hydrolase Pth2 [Aeropyrum camini]|uniref:Peptidyl-tRNA hydrolase n=1 Tax=Aeropyrum camini SY1 = JCM 12091 TaxID=1198449 RepID=U3TEQ0_9CREN|nr:peptidyl-tRNA hydrolase Pth2 [Aeropyrum camini]BAN90510.1 peptidyl-tRNA hydrolase [Aeropyrum camini SY1 = JCM 12091]